MTKIELFAFSKPPFFYFDSDIVWLRPFQPIKRVDVGSIFSTESWCGYYCMSRPGEWIKEKVPARINSGFAFVNTEFPFQSLENLLEKGLFNPDNQGATDQELFAFLFRETSVFSIKDFMRSRVGIRYDLNRLKSVALHFPGRMWELHLNQIRAFKPNTRLPPKVVEFAKPKSLNYYELAKMGLIRYSQINPVLYKVADLYRKVRRITYDLARKMFC